MIFLLVSAYGMTMFCMAGTDNVAYFFTRQKFRWLLKEYNIFSAINMIIIVFGMFCGTVLFQKLCKMSDGLLLILSYISSIADVIVRCFAKKSWHLYLGKMFLCFFPLNIPIIGSCH